MANTTPRHDLLDRMLSDIEKEKLRQFVEDEVQLEAVKKVLLFNIYNNGVLKAGQPAEPLRNFALSIFDQMRAGVDDDKLGRTLRGMCEGIYYLETGLKDIQGIIERARQPKVG